MADKFFDGGDLVTARLKGPEAMRELMQKGKATANAIMQEVNDIAKPHIPEGDCDWEYVIGFSWDCPDSPFGLCMYHRFEDRAHDCCHFCGDPEERK